LFFGEVLVDTFFVGYLHYPSIGYRIVTVGFECHLCLAKTAYVSCFASKQRDVDCASADMSDFVFRQIPFVLEAPEEAPQHVHIYGRMQSSRSEVRVPLVAWPIALLYKCISVLEAPDEACAVRAGIF
jgi:hypothetical protein